MRARNGAAVAIFSSVAVLVSALVMGASFVACPAPARAADAPATPARAADAPATPARAADAPATLRILDVPYVPQSERLCGGAALAMVLRYWGDTRVRAEDFAGLVISGENGIRGDSLVAAARARNCPVFPMTATLNDMRDHLARGRPLIALVNTGPASRHYVVILAATPTGLILHDPAIAPFRAQTTQEFEKAWEGAGRWALLVLPPQGRETLADPSKAALEMGRGTGTPTPPPPDTTGLDTPVIPEVAASGPTIAGCDGLVAEGVKKARSGADREAEGLLTAAAAVCPGSAAPVRELAGLRFREKRYAEAGGLARQALAIDGNDAYTWRLYAGTRYMDGDVKEALDAWNHVSEPRTDLLKVEGLRRTRYEAVADQVDLPPGVLLTWNEYRLGQHRLDEIPAARRARMEVQPTEGGAAQVRVAVVERPLLFDGWLDVAMVAGRAVARNEAVLRVSSPLRLGETWTARYRFRKNRPRAMLTMDAPALTGRPGLWHLEGMWERQTYALEITGTDLDHAEADVEGPRIREERQRGALTYGDWIAPDWRVEFGAGADRFEDVFLEPSLPGADAAQFFTAQAAIEARSVGDHFCFTGSAAGWAGADEHPFRAGDVLARYGSDNFHSGDWLLRAGYSAASSSAPLAVWPGAGTGTGRGALLRAHPLLKTGIVNGLVFGREVAHGGIERRIFPWEVRSVRIGLAAFVDVAKAWKALLPRDVPLQCDVGGGIRLTSLGGHGELRADFGYGLEDQETAFTVGFEGR